MQLIAPHSSSLPGLLAGRPAAEFEEFKNRFLALVKPGDVIEEVWAHDFVVLVWDIEGYRQIKAALIASVRTVALINVLALIKGDLFGAGKEEKDIAAEWFESAAGRQRVRDMLASRDLSETAIEAEAVRLRLEQLEKLDDRIASAQTRRDRVLQQISDYRSFFAQTVKSPAEVIEHSSLGSEEVRHAAE